MKKFHQQNLNNKIKEFTTIFLIQLVLTLPFYTASAYGLTISNVRVVSVNSNSATIEWGTDNISNGRVKYGKTTALGFTQRHDNFIGDHSLTLFNGIETDTTYFFSVESTDLAGNTAVDNNSNTFYTFKTPDITPPPQVTGVSAVSTTPTSIFLSWNNVNASDLSHYVVYRNRIPVGNATANSFNDTNLSSATAFSYKVSAVDNSSNEGPQSDTIIASSLAIDSTAPLISNVDLLPITDTTAKVTWITDENSTTIVLYGVNRTDKSKSTAQLTTNHSIVIDGLLKNVEHNFTVKSCDASNNCANSSRSFVAGRDITLPFINLSIPRFFNRRTIDIIGSTEPFSSVTLFVNNMNIPKRSLSSSEIGSSGTFAFSQIQLEQDNIIKVVFVDKSGNKNEKIFELSVDIEDPIVQLNEIPSLTSKPNVTISGSTNEPATINVFVDANVKEVTTPSKTAGLNTTKIGQNSVEIHWDESKDKDFSHYAVYRDNAAIALTKPANFNLFIDALVDSGRSYTYQVSAVNIFGKEGPKSEPIGVTTLKGGAILNIQYPEIDIFEDFRKPLLIVNVSSPFSFNIKLNKGDGTYLIKLIFEDRAQNKVVFDRSVTLDTKKPEVKIISPPAGAFIFENVANEVDVIGRTKPNARVHLFVDRTPFSFFNKTLELSGLPNEIQNLPESELDAKCRFNVASKSFCSTGADFSVTADEQGNFGFERVDLTALFGGAGRIREVPVTEFRDSQLNPEAKEAKTTVLIVIATDAVGQRGFATQTVRIGTCWSGNQSWNIIPLTQYQSPTLLSTERFAEGTETLYFYFNYSYIGIGSDAKITGISLSKACGTRELLDPRFNISCQIMPSGNRPTKLNKEGTLSYSAIQLARFPGMDRFLEQDWKSFFKAINNELTFPFKVSITYEHWVTDESGKNKRVQEIQTACEQVSYVIDNSIVDPRKVLPDFLLFDFVDFLQNSIKTLTKVQEQIDKLVDYVAVGCLSSFGLNFVMQVYRRWITFWDEKSYTVLKNVRDIAKVAEVFQKNPLKPANNEDKDYCEETIKKIVEKRGGFKLSYMNNADLKKCFPSSASAWESEAKVYSFLRWSCDRIFGHAAPAGWTEKKDDAELIRRVESSEGCAIDQSVRGQPLKAESCRNIVTSFPLLDKERYTLDDKCFRVDKGTSKALFKLGEQREGNVYEIEKVTGPADISISYAIKRDEFNYLTAPSKSCDEICGIKTDAPKTRLRLVGEEATLATDKKGNEVGAFCTQVDKCRSLNAHDANKKFYDDKNKIHDIKSAEPRGFATNCFYNPNAGDSINVVSDLPAQREECCCINAKEGPPSNYYQPDDKDMADEAKFVHESKTVPGQQPQQQTNDLKGYSDMEWSYRYWKEKFEAKGKDGQIHKEYQPHRYIEGRDFPACFGQNNLLYEFLGEPEKVLIVDPFKQHEAALQCAHLAGISNRIQFIKNLMTSMSTCLIQVRTTGRGDAGACKELFTQYLCNSIWQVIRWFVDGCAPIGAGVDLGKQDDEYSLGTYLKTGFKGIYASVADLQNEIRQEYGNAKLNELLGTGEESIARKICLGAFGYDWEFNVKNLVDAAYATPFATLVQPITRSREFLTVDPVTFKPKYEYRASWIINPGCDFERYDIYLTCVGRKQLDQYPNSVNCGALGAPSVAYTGPLGTAVGYSQCDCINLPEEKSTLLFNGRSLRQNILDDKSAVHKVLDDNIRYDHLKFVLRPDRKITPNIKPNCFPTGYDDGVFYFPLIDKTARDISDCTLDYTSGVYSCSPGAAFFSRKGTAEIVEVTINGENANKVKELSIGDKLIVGARVTKTGQDKCLRVSISPDNIQPLYTGITLNGTNDVEQIRITDSLRVAARTGEVIARGLSYKLISQNNDVPVTINANFVSEDDSVFNLNDKTGNDKAQIETLSDALKPIGELFDSDGKLTISKNDAKIEITGVSLNSPTIQGQPYALQTTITINPPQQVAQTAQQKTILVELFHLKDDRDSYTNIEDCNINDRIGEPARYPINVVLSKGVDVKVLEPLIKSIKIAPSNPRVGQDIVISATITHASGISDARLTINGLDGTEVILSQPMDKDGDNFEYRLSTSTLNAGTYNLNINAVSRENTKSNKQLTFKLV